MFLKLIERRNPALLRAAIGLHQADKIPAGSYALDLDAMRRNAEVLSRSAQRHGLRIFGMTKQFGRNPEALAAIHEGGIDEGVAVDLDCARALVAGGIRLGHVGHLVQIPRGAAGEVASLDPAFWTVFSEEKAAEAAAAAYDRGATVDLLARIVREGNHFYSGHEGGFSAERIGAVAERIDSLAGARFGGITTFPALLFDTETRTVRPTPNLRTLTDTAETLAKLGYTRIDVNAPGTTSSVVLDILAGAGATQVEPGHALTGTTPSHAVEDLPEDPAMVYVSEISHVFGGRSWFFGGGLYADPVFPEYQVEALVASDADDPGSRAAVWMPPRESIDYYGTLDGEFTPGSSVVLAFRAQAFVTRATIVGVSDAAGRPEAGPTRTPLGTLAEVPR